MKAAEAKQHSNGPAKTLKEKQYLRILNSMPGLALVIDRDFKIVFSKCHGAFEDVVQTQTGRKRYCYNVCCKSAKCDACHLEGVFSSGIPVYTLKNCSFAKDHKVYAFPVFDESGTVVMVGEVQCGSSDVLRMVNETCESQQMLGAIIEAAPLTTIALDNELRVILWNPAAERMLGWKKEEVIGKIYPLLFTVFREEIVETTCQIKMGNLFNFVETQRMRKDGSLIDVSLSTASLRSNSGIAVGYVAIMDDITEHKRAQQALKESEASYRTIFDAANDAHFVFDAKDATILDVNLKMCEMYGFDNREEALKHNVEEMMAGYPPYTLKDLLPLIWKAKDGKSQHFEWLAKHTSGRLFWMEVVMKGVIISGEYKVLAVVRDTMERKSAEEEKRKMQEKLLHADKMAAIGTLASGIAHEINNPNNFILSNAQFLSVVWPDINRILTRYAQENGELFLYKMRYSEASSKIPKIIDGIAEGAHRIKGIVTSLKDFSRQEKTFLEKEVDVNQVIEAALTMLQSKIKKHTDFFECRLGEDIPLVKGNFRQLEQVIVNLTLNALEALPARDRGVKITTSYSEYTGQVIIKVSDEGEGMSEEVQKSIFDPFFTTKLDTGGTGLGLSICFTIIKKHHGTIECDSELGVGTIFLIMMPAIKDNK
ncbi:PAS domain-containing sensor histidine kinase [bacterium]|nr:PAS domain-containing sensor histidine kinase [bacterium]